MPSMDYVAIGIYEEHRRSKTSPKTHLGYDLRDDDYITIPDRKKRKSKVKKPKKPFTPKTLKRGGWGHIGISRLSKEKR